MKVMVLIDGDWVVRHLTHWRVDADGRLFYSTATVYRGVAVASCWRKA